VTTVTDGISSNSDSMQTCCKQQHSSAVANVSSDDKRNVIPADYVAEAGAVNDFELLGVGETRHRVHSQPDQPDIDCLSSTTDDVKLKKYNKQMLMSWQRSRSLIVVVLGLIVRLCFSSVFLSRFMQVASVICCICLLRFF